MHISSHIFLNHRLRHAYIPSHTHTHTHILTDTHIHTNIHSHTYKHPHTPTHTHTHIHTYYICTHTHITHTHIHPHTHKHPHTHTRCMYRIPPHPPNQISLRMTQQCIAPYLHAVSRCVCECVRVRVCVCVCVCVWVRSWWTLQYFSRPPNCFSHFLWSWSFQISLWYHHRKSDVCVCDVMCIQIIILLQSLII